MTSAIAGGNGSAAALDGAGAALDWDVAVLGPDFEHATKSAAQPVTAIAMRAAAHRVRHCMADQPVTTDLHGPRREVRVFFAAGFALQIVLAVFLVEAAHIFVFQVEPAQQALALTGCRYRHDDLPPRRAGSYPRTSRRHA